MTIRLRSTCRFLSFSVRACVRVAFTTRALRRFTVVSLTLTGREDRRRSNLSNVFVRGRVSSLFFNMFRRLFATTMTMNYANANGRRARVVMGLNDNAGNEAEILINNLLLSTSSQARANGLVCVQTLRVTRRITNVNERHLSVTTLALNGSNVRDRQQLTQAQGSNCRNRKIT